MRIEVTEEVGQEVRRICDILNVTPDALFRRLLKLPDNEDTPLPRVPAARPQAPNGLTTRDGVLLPAGLQLRARYKGKEYLATVERNGISVEGIVRKFTSPSLAGVAVAGYPVNGWTFWEYFDEKRGGWCVLDERRPSG